MSSPAKKRKKNDHISSNQPIRSLEHFFNKQVERNKPIVAEELEIPNSDETETDEQLAQRLQAEFDKEYEGNDPNINRAIEVPKKSKPDHHIQAVDKTARIDHLSSVPLPQQSSIADIQTLSLQSGSTDSDSFTAAIPLADSILNFNPQDYLPTLKSHWASLTSSNAQYAFLIHAFTLINATASRLAIQAILTNTLRTIIEADPSSLLPAVWLSTNSIAPPFISRELGLGGSSIAKALTRTTGLPPATLRTLFATHGDAGDVAYEAKTRAASYTLRKPAPLTIRGVFDSLIAIAAAKGTGSVEAKQRIVERLLRDARAGDEARFLVRTLAQHLRIGAVRNTMLVALARAFLVARPPAPATAGDGGGGGAGAQYSIYALEDLAAMSKEQVSAMYARAEECVRACYARRPDYGTLVQALLEVGVSDGGAALRARCGVTVGVPLCAMLGSITRDLSDVFARLAGRAFVAEYKYDGQRAQVHCDAGGRVRIFSRHLEDMTGQYPDLVGLVPQIKGDGVESFILEGEVVAVDAETGQSRPFQTLANRARGQVSIGDVKVQVCLFSFDVMYLNGEPLLSMSFRERRNLLKTRFLEIPKRFTWVKSIVADEANADAVQEFFKNALAEKCEGIMVKVLDNPPDAIITTDIITEEEEEDLEVDVVSPAKKPLKSKPKKSKKSATSDDKDKPSEPKKSRRKALLATYEPDKRLDSWLKVKKDYNATTDTLDLVPIGGWHGSGRKNKWWSPILLAAFQSDTGRLVAVTKCMSGFTDAFYIANREKYAPGGPNIKDEKPAFVEYDGEPEVWFEPQEVWEIVFADITQSPTYTAGIEQMGERGLSLRFPRFLKVREDKGIEEASTEDFLVDLYWKQAGVEGERHG